MKKTFYSNGKLLITAEYLVLDGAKALALPTKFGQNLIVEPAQNKIIHWKSIDSDGTIWFEANIPFSSIIKKEQFGDKENIKDKLIEILHEAYLLNSNFITESEGYSITTELTFPKFWGLGTSSTLINNIAKWLNINAFELQKRSFGGSGYDVACAKTDSAILYQLINEKPFIETINYKPVFSDKIFFVYLNKKQNSRTAIANYYNKQGNVKNIISKIDKITQEIIATNEPKVFANASFISKPSVTLVTIFVAVALLTMSSPTPVQLTAQNSLAKFPATVAESEILPGISKPFPPVEVDAANFPDLSKATQPTVPLPKLSTFARYSFLRCGISVE
jgi:mevalonate kinase